jgi:drug/metabolite transporter (DMT)-like permease
MTAIDPASTKSSQTCGLDRVSADERRMRRAGIALQLGAIIMFSLLDTTGKWLNLHVPLLMMVWFRYFSATLLTLVMVNPFRHGNVFRSNRPFIQLARAVLLVASTIFNFLALQKLQLADAVSIGFSLPLIVALMAGPLLGEWIGPRRLVAIVVGFLGVLVVTRPGADFQPAMLWSFMATLCYATYAILTRMIAAQDSWRTTTLYSAMSGLLLTPLLPGVWVWPESGLVWAMLFVIGVFGGLGHWLLILAHQRAPAAILAPFVYTQIVWMSALGWIVFRDAPGPWTLAGGAIVIASGLYLWARERAVRGE